jgi:hypothetical protein
MHDGLHALARRSPIREELHQLRQASSQLDRGGVGRAKVIA